MQDLYWTQHVERPTRFRGQNEPSLLDIVLTKKEEMMEHISCHPPLEATDHLTLLAKLRLYPDRNRVQREQLVLNKADDYKIRKNLAKIDWDMLFYGTDIQ